MTGLQRWLADLNPNAEPSLEENAAAWARGEDPGTVPAVEIAKNYLFQSAVSMGVARSFYYSLSHDDRQRVADNCVAGAAEQVLRGIWPATKACLVSQIKTRMVATIYEQMKFYNYYRVRDPRSITVDPNRITIGVNGKGKLLGATSRDDYTGVEASTLYTNDVPSYENYPSGLARMSGPEPLAAGIIFDDADGLDRTEQSPFGQAALGRLQATEAEERERADRRERADTEWQERKEKLIAHAAQWATPWDKSPGGIQVPGPKPEERERWKRDRGAPVPEPEAVSTLSPRDRSIWDHRGDARGTVAELASALGMKPSAYRKARQRVKAQVR